MRVHKLTYMAISAALVLSSCIENDVPYPYVNPQIQSIEIEGATDIEINSTDRVITATLDEEVDMKNVSISNIRFTEKELTTCEPAIKGSYDLNSPLNFALKVYDYQYDWKIKAVQPIERYFTVSGIVGSSVIDSKNHRVILYVSQKTILSQIHVTSMKLGPKNITEYSLSADQITDLNEEIDLEVKYHDIVEHWMIFAEKTESSVQMNYVNAWSKVVWLSASGIEGQDNGFCYRKVGSDNWIKVNKNKITHDGGSFSCSIEVEPLTSYECYAYSGSESTPAQEFTTEGIEQLPNSDFEVVSNAEGNFASFYDPASSDETLKVKFWDSGNVASAGYGFTICYSDTDELPQGTSTRSVRLQSAYAIVKFAAGNIFTGEFAGLDGLDGKVNFGRPFTLRPRKVRLKVKYNCGTIDYMKEVPDGKNLKLGDNDFCSVYVALGDWDYKKYGGTPESPVLVNTADKSTFFNPKSDGVIAYGEFTRNSSIEDWTEIEIPLDYYSLNRKPTHIIVACASSLYGDYFTGSSKSTMWVDDFTLVY